MATKVEIAGMRHARDLARGLARDLTVLREDAGLSQRRLAGVAGISQGHLSRIESGEAGGSVETYSRLALALGADLAMRLYPSTGPSIRDRHQVRIVEALLASRAARWRAAVEVPVWRPVRGWIDVVLADPQSGAVVAVEVESSLRRIEQLLRWSTAKAEALPSARDWPFGTAGGPTPVSRLLVVRSTRATREAGALAAETFAASLPGDPRQALAALTGEGSWPGPSLLWARERVDGSIRLAADAGASRSARRR
ncbi:MAG: helix-turn-helix transcriptional regulator [Chloroflexi bacterium]|nr:helix-turn-helix transcriptional regulator [Chloroflexota bacterium]